MLESCLTFVDKSTKLLFVIVLFFFFQLTCCMNFDEKILRLIRVGRFRSNMHKWGVALTVTCECGLGEQITNHELYQCPFYCALSGARDLWKPGNKTTSWLCRTCPNI